MDDVVQRLIDLKEIQAFCFAGYGVMLLVLMGLIGIFIAHSAYVVAGHKLMYRKKPPQDGWNKQFYPALLLLTLLVAVVAWFFWQFSQGVVPFA